MSSLIWTVKVVVVGKARPHGDSAHSDMALWRFTADGKLDSSFGNGGHVLHDGAGDDDGQAAILEGNTLLVVGASQSAASGMEMTIWRFTTAGVLDLTLDGTGHYSHGGPHADRGMAIAARGNRVAVVGTSSNGTDDDLAVWCLTRTP